MQILKIGQLTIQTRLKMTDTLFEGSLHSSLYNKFRPVAPISIVNEILKYCDTSIDKCIDVGCGTGLFTKLMIPHCKHIVGIDVSSTQIKEANKSIKTANVTTSTNKLNTVEFVCGSGSKLPATENSMDLITCCQALHWFDQKEFYDEVYRVLKHNGILAIIGHSFCTPSPVMNSAVELQNHLSEFYNLSKPYWSSKRTLVDNKYRDILKPDMLTECVRQDKHFSEIDASVDDWIGYISTWSGFQTMKKDLGEEKTDSMLSKLKQDCFTVITSHNENPQELRLRTNFWLLLYRKSEMADRCR